MPATPGNKLTYLYTQIRLRWLHPVRRHDTYGVIPPAGGRPRHGFGMDGRALWNELDLTAEVIRRVLCRAGLRQWRPQEDGHAAGFIVMYSSPTGRRFVVQFNGITDVVDRWMLLARCAHALGAAGYRVNPDDTSILLVTPPTTR